MKKWLSVSSTLLSAISSALMLCSMPVTAREDLRNLNFFPQPISSETVTGPLLAPALDLPIADQEFLDDAEGDMAIAESIAKYTLQASDTENRSGPYDPGLIQTYQTLASLYQQSGDLHKAVEMLNLQLQVIRVTKGLFSIEQGDVFRSLVNTHVEAGDLESAHLYQEALLNLEMRAYGKDSLQFVSSRLEWADWNMNHYLTLSAEETSRTGRKIEDPRVVAAYDNYVAALEIMQNNSRYADQRMITTERKLAALNFIVNRKMHDLSRTPAASTNWQAAVQAQQQKLEQADAAHFFNGSSALKRAIVYSSSSPQPDYDFIAQRMMELGDWYLLFDRRAAAIDIYSNALEVLTAANIPEKEINRILSPGLPVQIPDLTWQQPAESDQYAGFIDVEFELSRYGVASNPQILSSTEQDTRIEKELIRTIRKCKFRPMIADGTLLDNEKVKLRYYYTL